MRLHDKKTTFPAELCDEFYIISITKKKNIQAKKFRVTSISAKKKTFPKEFFNEISLY